MGVTDEQQVFSGQQFHSFPRSNTAVELIFVFPIKIVINICSNPSTKVNCPLFLSHNNLNCNTSKLAAKLQNVAF
jgi:hypothetical protein